MAHGVTSGSMNMQMAMLFEALEGGTKFTMAAEGEFGGFFKLAKGMVNRKWRAQMDESLGNLKQTLEAGGTRRRASTSFGNHMQLGDSGRLWCLGPISLGVPGEVRQQVCSPSLELCWRNCLGYRPVPTDFGHSGLLGRFFDLDFSDPEYALISLGHDFCPFRRHDGSPGSRHRGGGGTLI